MGAAANSPLNQAKVLVTGGGGFVGTAVVRRLVDLGAQTAVLGRSEYPHLAKLGVQCHRGSVTDTNIVGLACRNADVVFHVAALAGIWGGWSDYYQTNVIGTRNILQGCQKNGVKAVVYTSTPSVVFNQHDILGQDEKHLDYASSFLCNYAKSKVIAEREMLTAARPDFHTTALRPHLIWGPEDPHLLPRLLQRGREKALKVIGDGQNKVDLTYIENVAHAHILAAENLLTTATATGKAYFISDGDPVNLWQWINELFAAMGVAPIKRQVPFQLAYLVGWLLEYGYHVFAPEKEPKMTRFLAEQLAKNHYFSIDQARSDLGYTPIVTPEDGWHRTIQWLQNKSSEQPVR
jgi:nucleoside-diphosphate-sugar epimerase